MSSNNDEYNSSTTSSYSSAEGTPLTSPINKSINCKINELKVQKSEELIDTIGRVETSTSLKPNNCANKRSSSDGAMKALEGSVYVITPIGQHHRSRSDCDSLIATTKAKMCEKFDQLEKESGIQLKTNKTKSNNESKEETNDVNKCVERFSRSLSISEVKEQAYHRMHSELKRAQNDLKLRDEEVAKLSRIREEVESELEDLTASLFEEANNMVYEANVLRSKAEKELLEANMKIDVLQAEVQALKMLVLTSTPSMPNPHLHPQIDSSVRSNGVKSLLNRSNLNNLAKKSPSNYELGGSPPKLIHNNAQNALQNGAHDVFCDDYNGIGEVDPVFHEEFVEWKKCPTFEPMNSSFIKRIYDEEIYPVFNFKDKDLTSQVLRAIEDNSIIIEAVGEKSSFPKRCALLDAPRNCKYRMKLVDNWYNISQLCRNRIIAVCDLFCYLRYIERGLVKSSFKEVYWEIIRRRRDIALSRLGFACL